MKTLRVTYGQPIYDDREIERVVRVLKEHRSIMGPEIEEFEKRVSKLFRKRYGIMVNSGSSANLLAVELMNLPPGSEVITSALTFSTTVAPLLKRGLIPVFIDIKENAYIIDVDKVEKSISKKTKALMIPLMFGNVPDMEKLARLAKKYKLLFIEDSCDTMVSYFKGKPTGFYSDFTTTSFYGSHIITGAGGGGMLMVNKEEFRDKARVLRGWGRSSAVFNESESIKSRFGSNIDNIQYDGKFTFTDIGYNFLPLEISAAFGNVQLTRLKKFIKIRQRNFKYLTNFFSKHANYFALPLADKNAVVEWQVFPLTIKENAPFARIDLVTYLEKNNIQTRPLATGNILRQPGFKNIPRRDTQKEYSAADAAMERGFMIGLHHGLTLKHLRYVSQVIDAFLKLKKY